MQWYSVPGNQGSGTTAIITASRLLFELLPSFFLAYQGMLVVLLEMNYVEVEGGMECLDDL